MQKQEVNILSTEFLPKNEYILVKPVPLEDEKKTESGLIIALKPASSLDRPTSGTVVSVGSDITDITKDMFVLWPGTDGLDIIFKDGEFVLLRYKSIIGCKR